MNTIPSILGMAALTLIGLTSDAMALGNGPCAADTLPCLGKLHLTVQQDRQVDRFRDFAVGELNALAVQIDHKQKELYFLSRARRPNPHAIVRKQAEITSLRDRQQAVRATFQASVQSVLHPFQRAQYASCTANSGSGRGHDRVVDDPGNVAHVRAPDYRRQGIAVGGRLTPVRTR